MTNTRYGGARVPSAFAVLRLITSSNFVGCSRMPPGKDADRAPSWPLQFKCCVIVAAPRHGFLYVYGIPRVNDRRVLNGIFCVLRSGAPKWPLSERKLMSRVPLACTPTAYVIEASYLLAMPFAASELHQLIN
jgi:hypothetical protein